MAFITDDERGYNRLGDLGNIDMYEFLNWCNDKDEEKNRKRFESENPKMYNEYLEWEEEFIKRHEND